MTFCKYNDYMCQTHLQGRYSRPNLQYLLKGEIEMWFPHIDQQYEFVYKFWKCQNVADLLPGRLSKSDNLHEL